MHSYLDAPLPLQSTSTANGSASVDMGPHTNPHILRWVMKDGRVGATTPPPKHSINIRRYKKIRGWGDGCGHHNGSPGTLTKDEVDIGSAASLEEIETTYPVVTEWGRILVEEVLVGLGISHHTPLL